MPPRSRLVEALVLAAILSAFWLVRWPFREVVLIRDEGEYAYIGQRILHGEVPYRDVYDQKTPLVFYSMAAGQRLLGPSVSELRLFGSAWGLLSTGAVYALARVALGPLGAAAAALSFGAMVFDQAGIFHQASTEYFMLLWLALGVLAWRKTGGPARPGWAALAGALAGLACLTKQSGGALLVFFAADALWRRRRAGRAAFAAAAGDSASALAGFAAVLALAAAGFAAQGALDEFVAAAWLDIGGYVGGHYRNAQLAEQLANIAEIVGRDAGFWLVGAFGLLLAARSRSDAASGWWLLLLVLLAAAIGPGGNSRHYFLPVVLPFALGMGALAQSLPQQAGATRVAFALALLLPWLGPLSLGWNVLHPDLAHAPPRLLRPFDRAEVVARAIAERTEREERVLIVGSEPEIYYLADRPAATRLIHLYTATGPYPSAPTLRAEFMRDLDTRPRYVLLVNVASSLTEFPDRLGAFLRPVVQVLKSDYVVEERWDGPGQDVALGGFGTAEFLLWRRRD
jgi:4-amino-4-deoxy-L-arabinose transferase-like glycosyltransferase